MTTTRRVLIGACLVVREHAGERLVLMVTGEDGWQLPGGHVDAGDFRGARIRGGARGADGETWSAAHAAAARELWEETGLHALDLERLLVAESDAGYVPALVHVFRCKLARGRVVPNAEPGTHARWFPWLAWPAGRLDAFFRRELPRGLAPFPPTEFLP